MICNIYKREFIRRGRIIAMFEDRILTINVPIFECICMKMCKSECFKKRDNGSSKVREIRENFLSKLFQRTISR